MNQAEFDELQAQIEQNLMDAAVAVIEQDGQTGIPHKGLYIFEYMTDEGERYLAWTSTESATSWDKLGFVESYKESLVTQGFLRMSDDEPS